MKALHRLLTELRDEVLASFDATVRSAEGIESMGPSEIRDGLPEFLDLIRSGDSNALLGAQRAREHGRQRFQLGFSAQDVVYEYGVLLEVLHDVAERNVLLLSRAEARYLDRVFFDASYRAVAEFASQQERARAEQAGKHISFLAHDLRDALNTAQLALIVLRRQPTRADRAMDAIERGLERIHGMVQRTLVAGWLNAHATVKLEEIRLREFLAGIANEHGLEGEARGQHVVVDVDAPLTL
jgi:signal transduction histidine kinase